MKALNEIKSSLGWRVVYSWVGDDPCGDGDLPPWSGVTCSVQGDYRVVTGLYVKLSCFLVYNYSSDYIMYSVVLCLYYIMIFFARSSSLLFFLE